MARRLGRFIVVGMCFSACGTDSGDDLASPPTTQSAAEGPSPSGEPTSVESAGDDDTDTAAPVETVVESTIGGSPVPAGPDAFVALYECLASHGVDAQDPAQPGTPISVGTYPPEVAAEAWGACRGLYLDALRLSISGFDVDVELASEVAPLAFADCMATLGWVTPGVLPLPVVVDDLADYTQANAVCRSPVEGEPVEASYCRFLHAIADRARHDPSMSTTGSPYTGTEESRRQAAVALYDEALQIAPDVLIDDLHTLQEGFRQGGNAAPDAVWETLIDYNLSVCGAWVYLGSLG